MLISKWMFFILRAYCILGLNLILISEGLIWLELSNDGPAILESTIDFYAALKGDSLKDSYRYEFHCDLDKPVDLQCGVNCMYSLQLSNMHESGDFMMKVTVFEVDSPIEVASNKTTFMVTEYINGKIEIFKEGNVELENFIPSGKKVNLTAYLHDPNDFFHNATMSYFWQINDELQQDHNPIIQHTFNKTGQSHLSLVVKAEFQKSSIQRWGSFKKSITIQDEIPRINISGETWMSHGKMLNLNVTCNGSSPFLYCWEIYPGDKAKDNFTCDYPVTSNYCKFTVNYYLAAIGQYYISILVRNDVSTVGRSLDIRVFDMLPLSWNHYCYYCTADWCIPGGTTKLYGKYS